MANTRLPRRRLLISVLVLLTTAAIAAAVWGAVAAITGGESTTGPALSALALTITFVVLSWSVGILIYLIDMRRLGSYFHKLPCLRASFGGSNAAPDSSHH